MNVYRMILGVSCIIFGVGIVPSYAFATIGIGVTPSHIRFITEEGVDISARVTVISSADIPLDVSVDIDGDADIRIEPNHFPLGAGESSIVYVTSIAPTQHVSTTMRITATSLGNDVLQVIPGLHVPIQIDITPHVLNFLHMQFFISIFAFISALLGIIVLYHETQEQPRYRYINFLRSLRSRLSHKILK